MAKGTALFDFLNDITLGKENLMDNEAAERLYPAYMVNRGLSQHQDTILYAAEMNKYPQLDKKMQHDFLFYAIPARKRMSKWAKKVDPVALDAVKQVYGYNDEKAKAAIEVLTDEQIKTLKKRLETGGLKK